MIEGVTVVVTGLQDAVTATSVHVWEEEVKELQFIHLSLSIYIYIVGRVLNA